MPPFIVTFKAETAMLPYVVEADELQVLQSEDLAIFHASQPSPSKWRRVPLRLPLRFISAIDPADGEVLASSAGALYQQASTV